MVDSGISRPVHRPLLWVYLSIGNPLVKVRSFVVGISVRVTEALDMCDPKK
jgi:hypothetical protein